MTQRRKRPLPPSARRRPAPGRDLDAPSWALHHSPYTVEGEIEGMGRFAAGTRGGGPSAAWGGRAVVLVVLVPIALAVWQLVVTLAGG